VTKASATVKNLFANGVQMTLARYPNSGFIPITTTNGTSTLTGADIYQASGYWTGANWRGRTNNWTYETRTISAHNGTSLTLTTKPQFNLTVGWGFYLDNALAALDTAREWYCDTSTDSVYFWAPGGVDPNILVVNGSILDYGVNSSKDNITVNGLGFDYQNKAGLNFTGSNINLLSNTVYGGLVDGIDVAGDRATIDHNTVQSINGIGISSWASNTTFSNNVVSNIGTTKGYGKPYGIMSLGAYSTISYNSVDSVGYDGIVVVSYSLVEYNVLKHSMLTLCDGGAIYCGGQNTTIQKNIISDVTGDNEGTPHESDIYRSWTSANGIYLDSATSHYVVKDNTIIRANSSALVVNYGTHDHTLRNNICYDCASGTGGSFLYIGMDTASNDGAHVITKNIFYPRSSKQMIVKLQDFDAVLHSPGTVDQNYYFSPSAVDHPFDLMRKAGYWTEAEYSFLDWQNSTQLDPHSVATISNSKDDSLFVNTTASEMTVVLGNLAYRDLDSNLVTGTATIAPYSSKLLLREILAEKKND
jgi:hypothetical protein